MSEIVFEKMPELVFEAMSELGCQMEHLYHLRCVIAQYTHRTVYPAQ